MESFVALRTYTRIQAAEVRHTFTLTDDDRDALARWDSGGRAIDAIFERFDPDHEDVALCGEPDDLLVAREC